jgi:predicted ATPase
VTNKDGKLFFMYGNGGTGKTFVWTMFLSHLRGHKVDLIIWDEAPMMHR